ncbi:hypothetical protein Ddye_019691 [Dipteronia dyeriana]|uniref:Senescence regulator n=1 Tax=Dipteronia dyeriana TaxID=168575 RepID=A0AAD9TYP0_9ROSI|nr:hypothetical protein Ddye_019691 [Dipteronia dyeriana]
MADWQSKRSMNTTTKGEDFEEEDVWCFVSDHDLHHHQQQSCEDSSPHQMRRFKSTTSTTVAPKMIRRAHEANNKAHVQQSSAPVNIPDWSKIYGNNNKNANFLGSSSRNGSWVVDHGHCHGDGDNDDDDDDDDDNNNEDDMVPPHEWLAKKLARSQISSFSVCEGIGRTLKGRDLSKVRNAILTKTGFLE